MISLLPFTYLLSYLGIVLGILTKDEINELKTNLRTAVIIITLFSYGFLFPLIAESLWVLLLGVLFILFLETSQRTSLTLLYLHQVLLFMTAILFYSFLKPELLGFIMLPLVSLTILQSLLPFHWRREMIAIILMFLTPLFLFL